VRGGVEDEWKTDVFLTAIQSQHSLRFFQLIWCHSHFINWQQGSGH
jgi:hypothetical protein